MNNFKPGGQRNRKEFLGGRPKSDADYSTKKRFDKKPRHEDRGGFRNNGGDRGGRFDNNNGPKRDVELFDTKCTTCGKACQVPFRPDGSKPVLCRDCFATKNASPAAPGFERRDGNNFQKREEPRKEWSQPSKLQAPSVDISPLIKQVAVLETKMAEVIALLKEIKTPTVVVEEKKTVKKEVTKEVKKPTVEKPKKVAAKVEKKIAVKKVAVKKAAPKKAVKKAVKKVVKKK